MKNPTRTVDLVNHGIERESFFHVKTLVYPLSASSIVLVRYRYCTGK